MLVLRDREPGETRTPDIYFPGELRYQRFYASFKSAPPNPGLCPATGEFRASEGTGKEK